MRRQESRNSLTHIAHDTQRAKARRWPRHERAGGWPSAHCARATTYGGDDAPHPRPSHDAERTGARARDWGGGPSPQMPNPQKSPMGDGSGGGSGGRDARGRHGSLTRRGSGRAPRRRRIAWAAARGAPRGCRLLRRVYWLPNCSRPTPNCSRSASRWKARWRWSSGGRPAASHVESGSAALLRELSGGCAGADGANERDR